MLVGLLSMPIAMMQLLAIETSEAAQELTELTVAGIDWLEHLNSLPFEDPLLNAGGSLTQSAPGYSRDPLLDAGGSLTQRAPGRYMRWRIVDESLITKRITLIVGVRDSIAGSTRETTFETYRLSTY